MSDSEDRRRADLFEIELRRKADLDPGNCWELIWFLRLPLETRCSYMRILEARIDQDATRKYLARQSCYHQRDWRAPTRSCLVIEATAGRAKPWSSIGRRERRRPVKPRATPTRRQSSLQATVKQPTIHLPTPIPIPTEPDLYEVPARPATPDGLRKALSAIPMLVCDAVGYAPDTLDRCYSPKAPHTPPEPELEPEPASSNLTSEPENTPQESVQYEPFPEPYPRKEIWLQGKRVMEDFAYFAAVGRYFRVPQETYSVEFSAYDLQELERIYPEFYDLLRQAFSVQSEHFLVSLEPIFAMLVLDLVRGWSVVPDYRQEGLPLVPDSHPHCRHCGCYDF